MIKIFVNLLYLFSVLSFVSTLFESVNIADKVFESFLKEVIADSSFGQEFTQAVTGNLLNEFKKYCQELNDLQLHRSKRSSEENFNVKDLRRVTKFVECFTIPTRFPNDIKLIFMHNGNIATIFAVSLEVNKGNSSVIKPNEMVLREFDENSQTWLKKDTVSFNNSIKMEIKNFDGLFYIFHLTSEMSGKHEVSIFSLINSNFYLVQILNIGLADHISVWEEPNRNDIFLGVSVKRSLEPVKHFLYLYQWTNGYFDIFDVIPTSQITVLKSFRIDFDVYLAVGTRIDNSEGGNYIDVFKYNEEIESFKIHQKIQISNCHDIEYFHVKSNYLEITLDHFIVVISFDSENENKGSSVFYKFYNGFFYPFQIIESNYLQQWVPFNENEEVLLIGVSKYSGLHVYQFNGWNFVNTFSYSELSHVDSVSSFALIDSTVLVIADETNNGTRANVFKILSSETEFDQDTFPAFNSWYSTASSLIQNFSKLEVLEKIISTAPTSDASEIIFNGSLELSSVKNNRLLLVPSNQNVDSNNKEERLLERLDNKLDELKMLEDFTSKLVSSAGKFIINGDLYLNEFTMNCTEDCDLNVLSISELNGEDFEELLAHTINLEQPNLYDTSLDFENIAVSLQLFSSQINNHLTKNLVHKQKLKLENSVILKSNLTVDKIHVLGLIDNIKMLPSLIVLSSGNNVLNGSLLLHEGRIDNLRYIHQINDNEENYYCPEDTEKEVPFLRGTRMNIFDGKENNQSISLSSKSLNYHEILP